MRLIPQVAPGQRGCTIPPHAVNNDTCLFTAEYRTWGASSFIDCAVILSVSSLRNSSNTLQDLFDPSKNFVQNDMIMIEIDFDVFPIQ